LNLSTFFSIVLKTLKLDVLNAIDLEQG